MRTMIMIAFTMFSLAGCVAEATGPDESTDEAAQAEGTQVDQPADSGGATVDEPTRPHHCNSRLDENCREP